MVLDSIHKSLEILLSAPVAMNPVQWSASWNDSFSGLGENSGTISNATARTMVDPPYHAPFARDVTQLTIVNKDTVPATVTVRINNSGVFTVIFSFSLLVGGQVSFGNQTPVVVDSSGVPAGLATSAKQDTEIAALGTLAKESGGNLALIAAQTNVPFATETGNLKTLTGVTQTQQDLLYLILTELRVHSHMLNELLAPRYADLGVLRSDIIKGE